MKAKSIYPLILAFLILGHLNPIYGWGSKGHKIVAQIAKSCLKQPVIDSIQVFLGLVTFEDASVWMDEVRSDHSYDYLKPRHYVNVEKDKTYVATDKPNIINELDAVLSALKEKGPRDKEKVKMALLELFHLVGDIHQPLHCGYKDDKGGNDVQVRYLNKGSNLHKVWDSEIIEELNLTTNDVLKFSGTLLKKEKDAMQNVDVIEWMVESRSFLNGIYDFKDNKLDQEYTDKNSAVIKKQLLRAGVRLASVLNASFSK